MTKRTAGARREGTTRTDIDDTRRSMLIAAAAAASLAIYPMTSLAASPNPGARPMSSDIFTTKDGTQIYYKDWGSGQPIVFHHGWPLSADDWDAQMLFFLAQGYRVIAHDRRGHGRSSQTATGNEMDTYAADVAALAAHLDLKNAVHIGH